MRHATLAFVSWVLLCSFFFGGCAPSREELRNDAVVKLQVGEVEEAKLSLKRLLDHHPGDPDGYYLMGRAYHSERAYPQAIFYYQQCLDAAPWHSAAREWLGKAQQQSGLEHAGFQFVP